MPTYTVTTANLSLTKAQKHEIAALITRAHNHHTGAPGYFAQVIFQALDGDDHYIGGQPIAAATLYVLGLIRAGRADSVKTDLIVSIAAGVKEVAGLGAEDVWVYIQDIAAHQMLEFGRVLPEPGAEAAWRADFSQGKVDALKKAGVAI
jgi:phenylpyruvate tautomerase PptA (4-oxalocrotonate tautomerase family)